VSGKIEISRELGEKLADLLHGHGVEDTDAANELRALLAAPVVERQPVAYEYLSRALHCWRPLETEADKSRAESMGCAVRVAEQPAPVAVVLPERRAISEQSREQAMCANSWNACLDKVKELNQ
jgi:hypothetical protein